MTTHARWDAAERILCVRLDTLGDVVMTTPAMRALKTAAPGRRLTLLTSPAGAAVASMLPEVDDVVVYEAPWMKATAPRSTSQPDFAMIERLRTGGFDAAVVFTVFSQDPLPATMLCYLADIPLRLAHSRANPYQLLTDWVPEQEPEAGIRHEVQRQLDLVAAVGCRPNDTRMSLRVPASARQRVSARIAAWRLPPAQPWVVLHPGATAPSRRYPAELFAEVARRLAMDLGWHVVFTGSAPERELVAEIQRRMGAPSVSLAGQLDLGELAALLARAPLLVANNTGPVHMAAALGTPVVDLYALTNPQHTPWGVPSRVLFHDVPCRNCFKSVCPEGHQNCLRLVEPEAVAAAARELMALRVRAMAGVAP